MKYTIYQTREDWDNLYEATKKAGFGGEVPKMKKSQSYDGAITLYATLTGDYDLKELKKLKIAQIK